MNSFNNHTTNIKISKITSQVPENLTKTVSLSEVGTLEKSTTANMTEGVSEVLTLNSMEDFANTLLSLKHNEALAYGITKEIKNRILSTKLLKEKSHLKDAIARTKENFEWPNGQGIMMIDYDPSKNSDKALSKDELVATLKQVLPLDEISYIWWPSSSSNIVNSNTGINLTGLKGQRLYLHVLDATDIPRAGKVLVDRLWLDGHGLYEISSSGSLLERTIVDASVWQTNRLDFASGSACQPPLYQERGKPIINNGKIFNTNEFLKDLSKSEKNALEDLKSKKKGALHEEAKEIRKSYSERFAEKLNNQHSIDKATSTELANSAIQNHSLLAKYPIILDDGQIITVEYCLNNPKTFNGRNCLDPIDPDYKNRKVVGKIDLNNNPKIISLAHGKTVYRMRKHEEEIAFEKGNMNECVNEVIRRLRSNSDFFDYGDSIVKVVDSNIVALDATSLSYYLGEIIQFYIVKQKEEKDGNVTNDREDIDPPNNVTRTIISLGKERNLKKLIGISNIPIITKNNRYISSLGHDEETQTYFSLKKQTPTLQIIPSRIEVIDAVNKLMFPFKDFPLERDLDKSTLLASILTAFLRPILPTAPGIAIDAPTQGSGKTLLAKCLSILSTGESADVWPHTHTNSDEETRKRITTALKDGRQSLIWDNVIGQFHSASVSSLLTTPEWTDRILGASKSTKLTNKMLFIATGNNIILNGDFNRRFLKVRINAQVEKPFARSFDLDPEKYCIDNRESMAHSAAVLIRAWFSSESFQSKIFAPGRLASFEDWDLMVRQTINWIGTDVLPQEFCDILTNFNDAQDSDPDQENHAQILIKLYEIFGNNKFIASDIYNKAQEGEQNQDLYNALMDITNTNVLTTKSIAKTLSYRVGRIANGLVLNKAGKRDNTFCWQINSKEAA